MSNLNVIINCYNKLYRCSQTIMRMWCISICLFTYSIIPILAFLIAIILSCYMLDISIIELYYLSLENKSLFVSFGMGLISFYVTEIFMMVWFQGSNIIEALEDYLIRKMTTNYQKCLNLVRNFIIEMYRETGWNVLTLIVKQDIQRGVVLEKFGVTHDIPQDIVKLIHEFVFDKDLLLLLDTRDNDKGNETKDKLSKKVASLKPYEIFHMYNC